MRARSARLLLTAVLVTGCGAPAPPDRSADDTPGGTASAPAPTTTEARVPADDQTPDPGRTARPTGSPVDLAVRDLAERRSVAAESITVVRAAEVTWRNGALGCPRPGMSYTQALVPGALIVLALDGVTYEYHSGGRRPPFLCERPEPPAEGGG